MATSIATSRLSRVFALLIVCGLSIIGSQAGHGDALSPSNSFLEAEAAVRLPHCSEIVEEYIRLETDALKRSKKARDTTCSTTVNKLWTLFAGLTTASASDKTTGQTREKQLIRYAVNLATSHHSLYVKLFKLTDVLKTCDNNKNTYCECKSGASKCDFALQSSTFYIAQINLDPKKVEQLMKQIKNYLPASHTVIVYVHSDGATVSIYQAFANKTPLIRKTSTLSDFTTGLSSLIEKQSTTLNTADSNLLDLFEVRDQTHDSDGSLYLNSVKSVAIGGGYSDANCKKLAENLNKAKKVMCGPNLIGCKGTKQVGTGVTKKVLIFNVEEKDVVCDC